jgi:hypothetical protein
MESTFMISASSAEATSMAAFVFPTPVGPHITAIRGGEWIFITFQIKKKGLNLGEKSEKLK